MDKKGFLKKKVKKVAAAGGPGYGYKEPSPTPTSSKPYPMPVARDKRAPNPSASSDSSTWTIANPAATKPEIPAFSKPSKPVNDLDSRKRQLLEAEVNKIKKDTVRELKTKPLLRRMPMPSAPKTMPLPIQKIPLPKIDYQNNTIAPSKPKRQRWVPRRPSTFIA